nr:ribonuclease H [Tanacetum cinerariifolium]
VENGVIKLYFVNTEYQLADLFTKALGRDRIEFLTNKLGMRSFTPETLKQLTDEVDVSEIYMQEFWATATVHHHSIRFKMDNEKHIVNLESFMEMLHVCPRLPHQPFVEPPFEEEILAFLQFLGHGGAIRRPTNVNINKLHQPWRSFAAIINKCLTEKSSGYDSLRWNTKIQRRAMRFIILDLRKVIIHHFLSKDSSISRRNKVNWHYVRDDHMFSLIKLVSRYQNMQQFGALLPIELTNEDIRNSNTYKEYYAVATRATPPKPKASVRKTGSSSDTTITPPTADAGPRLTTSEKGKQAAKASKAKSLSALSKMKELVLYQGFLMYPLMSLRKRSLRILLMKKVMMMKERTVMVMMEDDRDDDKDDEEKGDDDEQAFDEEEFIHPSLGTHTEEETRDEESFDPIPKTPKNSDDEGNGEKNLRTNVGREEGHDEDEEEDKLYRDSDRLRDEAQKENDEFLKTIDVNMQKIIKEQVKEQVKETKSIHRSNEQRNLYKALVEAYESDKIILDTYGDTVTMKRHRDDDADIDEEPSVGSDRGSKRRREGKEPDESAVAEEPMQTTFEIQEPSHPEFDTGADDQPIVESSQHPEWFSQEKKPPTPNHDWNKHSTVDKQTLDTLTSELLAGPTYELMKGSRKILVELEFFLEEVYKAATDQLDWVNPEGQQYPHNLLKPLPLIPDSRGHRVIPFDHFINNDLEYLRGCASSRKYTTSVTKKKAADYGHIKWIEDLVPRTMWIQEPIGYDKHALWESPIRGVNVSSSTVLLLTWSLSIMIQRRVEDLQLGVKSCQKKLNLTKPDTYRSDLKCKEAYITYSNPRGFIYQNKDKQNRLMRIDELHKFSNGTLTDVRTALDDHLKGIWMKYLPQSIWRKSDKDKATAMIQAIDKRLKTRRIMRSLERFVGGRLYDGDFRML